VGEARELTGEPSGEADAVTEHSSVDVGALMAAVVLERSAAATLAPFISLRNPNTLLQPCRTPPSPRSGTASSGWGTAGSWSAGAPWCL
jgi:hypothetical protein